MRRLLGIATVLSVLALTACGTGDGDDAATPDPSSSSSEFGSPTPTATAAVAVRRPTCDTLLTPVQVSDLMDPGAQGIGDATTPAGGGRGSTVLELLQIMDGDSGAVHCTWVLPDSDAGATISIMSDPLVAHAGEVYLSTLTLEETTGATGERILTIRSLDGFAYTESHGFLDGVWVGVWDGFATESSAIVDAVFATLAADNPSRF